LCGYDGYSGRDYSHRKAWIQKRLRLLAETFAVDVCGFAIMENHLHLVLRNRPDQVRKMPAKEMAWRWLTVYPKRRDMDGRSDGPDPSEVRALIGDDKRMQEVRKRLSSISWFMRAMNEYVARRANHEDDCSGHFWERRFRCQRLLDESAILTCMAYVDLNPVRAKVAETPEDAEFTGAYERIGAARQKKRTAGSAGKKASAKKPLWLGRIFADDRRESPDLRLGMRFKDYLTLLDWTGRKLREGKRGAIPADLRPILERLQVQEDQWLRAAETYGSLFHYVAGRAANMVDAARAMGVKWLRGIGPSREVFAPPDPSSSG
jgi:REP element-mobilizing transposase RayT